MFSFHLVPHVSSRLSQASSSGAYSRIFTDGKPSLILSITSWRPSHSPLTVFVVPVPKIFLACAALILCKLKASSTHWQVRKDRNTPARTFLDQPNNVINRKNQKTNHSSYFGAVNLWIGLDMTREVLTVLTFDMPTCSSCQEVRQLNAHTIL